MQRFDPARRLQTEFARPPLCIIYERGVFNSLDESHAVLPLQLPLFNEMMCGDGVP